MFDPLLLENPYERIYQAALPSKDSPHTRQDIQNLIKHLGFMYNTFGQAIKDFVKVVALKYQQNEGELSPPIYTATFRTNDGKESQNNSKIDFKSTQNQLYPVTEPNRNSTTEKTLQHMHSINQESATAKDEEILFDNHSQQSSFSVQSHNERAQSPKSHSFNNMHQFQSQFFGMESPKRLAPIDLEASEANDGNNIFHLSHKQKLQDPNYIVIEQDEEGEAAKSNSPSEKKEKARVETSMEANEVLAEELNHSKSSSVRIYGGRKKKNRERLMGVTCIECEKYYKIMQTKGENICECTSRHRTNLPARKLRKEFTQDFDLE